MPTLTTLENRHWALANERMTALSEACEKADPRQRLAIIERFNSDPYWENQFDDLADQIRELDPNHSFLPENQIPV